MAKIGIMSFAHMHAFSYAACLKAMPDTELTAVWGAEHSEQTEYLRVFVGQLRKKIEPDPSDPTYLLTEPWVGYRFVPEPSGPR